jgi:hypothetical protein
MKKTILLVIGWIVLSTAFMLVTWNRFGIQTDTVFTGYVAQAPTWNPLDVVVRGDGVWYLDIVKHGYVPSADSSGVSNVVFFPFYPLLIWLFQYLFLGQAVLAGWLISIASLIGACLVLRRLIIDFHPEIDPEKAIWFALLFPTAVFFATVYSESLFLFLSIATVYALRKRSYALAGAIGCLASLTRVTGFLLLVIAMIEFFSQPDWKKRIDGLWLLLIPLGLLAFFAYHAIAFHDPLLFFHAEAGFGRSFRFSSDYWQPPPDLSRVVLGLDVAFFAFGLMVSFHIIRTIRRSYGIYMLATLGLAFMSGTLMAINRYEAVLFPIPMLFASMKPSRQPFILFVSTLLLAMNLMLFAQGSWVG